MTNPQPGAEITKVHQKEPKRLIQQERGEREGRGEGKKRERAKSEKERKNGGRGKLVYAQTPDVFTG
jgi:hypothetical protein